MIAIMNLGCVERAPGEVISIGLGRGVIDRPARRGASGTRRPRIYTLLHTRHVYSAILTIQSAGLRVTKNR